MNVDERISVRAKNARRGVRKAREYMCAQNRTFEPLIRSEDSSCKKSVHRYYRVSSQLLGNLHPILQGQSFRLFDHGICSLKNVNEKRQDVSRRRDRQVGASIVCKCFLGLNVGVEQLLFIEYALLCRRSLKS